MKKVRWRQEQLGRCRQWNALRAGAAAAAESDIWSGIICLPTVALCEGSTTDLRGLVPDLAPCGIRRRLAAAAPGCRPRRMGGSWNIPGMPRDRDAPGHGFSASVHCKGCTEQRNSWSPAEMGLAPTSWHTSHPAANPSGRRKQVTPHLWLHPKIAVSRSFPPELTSLI